MPTRGDSATRAATYHRDRASLQSPRARSTGELKAILCEQRDVGGGGLLSGRPAVVSRRDSVVSDRSMSTGLLALVPRVAVQIEPGLGFVETPGARDGHQIVSTH